LPLPLSVLLHPAPKPVILSEVVRALCERRSRRTPTRSKPSQPSTPFLRKICCCNCSCLFFPVSPERTGAPSFALVRRVGMYTLSQPALAFALAIAVVVACSFAFVIPQSSEGACCCPCPYLAAASRAEGPPHNSLGRTGVPKERFWILGVGEAQVNVPQEPER
jgi:hypothetical protein